MGVAGAKSAVVEDGYPVAGFYALDTLCDYDKGSAAHFAVYLRTELGFCAKVEG